MIVRICLHVLISAPLGMPAPQVFVISDNNLRVSWSEPETPNGELTGYYIYLNDRRFSTNSAKAGSYILTELLPYTIYRIQVCGKDVVFIAAKQ